MIFKVVPYAFRELYWNIPKIVEEYIVHNICTKFEMYAIVGTGCYTPIHVRIPEQIWSIYRELFISCYIILGKFIFQSWTLIIQPVLRDLFIAECADNFVFRYNSIFVVKDGSNLCLSDYQSHGKFFTETG